MDMANSTTITIADFPRTVGYAVVGTLSTAVNILTLAIFFKDRLLLSKSAIIVGIIIANFSVGLHIGCSGLIRLAFWSRLTSPVDAYVCSLTIVPLLHPFSHWSEGLFICLGGLERLLAINVPIWFHKEWTSRVSWRIVAVGYATVFVVVVGGFWASFYQPRATWSCTTVEVFDDSYILVSQLISAAGGAAGAILAFLALLTGWRRIRKLPLLSGDAGRMRKQLQRTKSMSFISLTDVGLIGVPNALSVIKWLVPTLVYPWYVRPYNANFAFCANAFVMFLALLVFNREFRSAAIKLFRVKKMNCCCSKSKVRVENGAGANKRRVGGGR